MDGEANTKPHSHSPDACGMFKCCWPPLAPVITSNLGSFVMRDRYTEYLARNL